VQQLVNTNCGAEGVVNMREFVRCHHYYGGIQ
jgi:hypothetical protein